MDTLVTACPPKKWWLKDDPFPLGFGLFSGENSLLNFGRVPLQMQFLVLSALVLVAVSALVLVMPLPPFASGKMKMSK